MVGDRGGSSPIRREIEPEVDRWNLIQLVRDRPGFIREAVDVDLESLDEKPHGFSGFGVSDSGGQRWASVEPSAPERSSRAARDETPRAEAA
jgi:hypothetical protein